MGAVLRKVTEPNVDPGFRDLIKSYPGCEKLRSCVQCGTCTGSCPVSVYMKDTPRKLVELVRAGMRAEVLQSPDIWFCASCYSCAVRCPQDINVTDLTYALRSIANRDSTNRSAEFYRSFTETVRRYGRVHEPTVMLLYHAHAAPFELPKKMPMGLTMLRKGRISVFGRHIEGLDEIRKLFGLSTADDNELRIGEGDR